MSNSSYYPQYLSDVQKAAASRSLPMSEVNREIKRLTGAALRDGDRRSVSEDGALSNPQKAAYGLFFRLHDNVFSGEQTYD